MEHYKHLTVLVSEMTDDLVLKILDDDIADHSLDDYIDYIRARRKRLHEIGEEETKPFPTTPIQIMKEATNSEHKLSFGGETVHHDHLDEPICELLRSENISYEYKRYFDDDQNDVVLWTPQGDVTFDVDEDDNPILPYQDIVEAMQLPTDKEIVAKLSDILTRRSPYTLKRIEDRAVDTTVVLKEIDLILARLDGDLITKEQALEEIAKVKAAV